MNKGVQMFLYEEKDIKLFFKRCITQIISDEYKNCKQFSFIVDTINGAILFAGSENKGLDIVSGDYDFMEIEVYENKEWQNYYYNSQSDHYDYRIRMEEGISSLTLELELKSQYDWPHSRFAIILITYLFRRFLTDEVDEKKKLPEDIVLTVSELQDSEQIVVFGNL